MKSLSFICSERWNNSKDRSEDQDTPAVPRVPNKRKIRDKKSEGDTKLDVVKYFSSLTKLILSDPYTNFTKLCDLEKYFEGELSHYAWFTAAAIIKDIQANSAIIDYDKNLGGEKKKVRECESFLEKFTFRLMETLKKILSSSTASFFMKLQAMTCFCELSFELARRTKTETYIHFLIKQIFLDLPIFHDFIRKSFQKIAEDGHDINTIFIFVNLLIDELLLKKLLFVSSIKCIINLLSLIKCETSDISDGGPRPLSKKCKVNNSLSCKISSQRSQTNLLESYIKKNQTYHKNCATLMRVNSKIMKIQFLLLDRVSKMPTLYDMVPNIVSSLRSLRHLISPQVFLDLTHKIKPIIGEISDSDITVRCLTSYLSFYLELEEPCFDIEFVFDKLSECNFQPSYNRQNFEQFICVLIDSRIFKPRATLIKLALFLSKFKDLVPDRIKSLPNFRNIILKEADLLPFN